MATKLDELLTDIDPSRTIDVVEQRINQALSSYHRKGNTVNTWDEYRECLADFMRNARNTALQAFRDTGGNIDFNFNEAITYLSREYPGNTVQTVFDIMQTGAEGGVYAIFRSLTRILAEEYSRNEINGRVSAFWESLSPEEKYAVPDKYMEKFKDVLPTHVIHDSASRLKASFWKVLQDHPRMMKRIREIR